MEVIILNLKDIMTTNVVSAKQNDNILEVAQLMKEHNIGAVPVCVENRKLIGIITDRDIVLRAIASGKDINTLAVDEVMTLNPVTATPETEVHEAARVMSAKKVRRLPIVSNDSLVGIVSLGDISVEPQLSNNAQHTLSNISQPSSPQFPQ